MKKSYIKPVVKIHAIGTCEIMAGSGTPPNNVLVGNMSGTQTPEPGILGGGGDAPEDATPTSKNHLWDDDWD